MVSASMTVQHIKWLEAGNKLAWRASVASLNILLTSTCWRNDHNGFSHQGPGLIDTVLTKKGSVARIYLPPDANCLLSVADHCFRSRNYVNLIVTRFGWRHSYLRGRGGGVVATTACTRFESAGGKRGRFNDAFRTPAPPTRHGRNKLCGTIYRRQTSYLCLSRLTTRDP